MNTWAIQHDPDDYPNGDSFDPSRFFQKDQVVHEPETNSESDIPRRQTYAFGAGRRICAGQRMAENSMMMSMAKLVWAFDISPIGEGLLDTSMKTAWKDAILTGPQEVPLNFKVRGESRKQIIEGEWERANTFLKKFE
jgi:cytochrome P450